MATLAEDNFTRANQSGFGTASDGTNTWASPVNGNGTAAIASNRGIFGNFNQDTQMVCGSHSSTTDINMLVKLSTSDLNNAAAILWRYSSASGGNGYRAGFYAGNLFVVDKYVNGSRSSVTSGSVSSYSTNSDLWIRLIHTSGGTLQIRWWADGSSEPSNFNSPYINQSETSFSSGDFGVSVYINSGGTASYGSFTVTDNASGNPPLDLVDTAVSTTVLALTPQIVDAHTATAQETWTAQASLGIVDISSVVEALLLSPAVVLSGSSVSTTLVDFTPPTVAPPDVIAYGRGGSTTGYGRSGSATGQGGTP